MPARSTRPSSSWPSRSSASAPRPTRPPAPAATARPATEPKAAPGTRAPMAPRPSPPRRARRSRGSTRKSDPADTGWAARTPPRLATHQASGPSGRPSRIWEQAGYSVTELVVIHEDERLVAVAKPAGQAMAPGGGVADADTLVARVAAHIGS